MFHTRFPFEGQVLVHQRYKGTSITTALEKVRPGSHRVAHDMELDVDFVTSAGACAVYLWDKDIAKPDWKDVGQRMKAALRYSRPTVYAVASPSTQARLTEIRNNITFRYRVPVIYVATPEDLAMYLLGSVSCSLKPAIKPSKRDANLNILAAVRLLPGVGEKRSIQLLHRFPSLKALHEASKEELREVLGGASGTKLWKMLHSSTASPLPLALDKTATKKHGANHD